MNDQLYTCPLKLASGEACIKRFRLKGPWLQDGLEKPEEPVSSENWPLSFYDTKSKHHKAAYGFRKSCREHYMWAHDVKPEDLPVRIALKRERSAAPDARTLERIATVRYLHPDQAPCSTIEGQCVWGTTRNIRTELPQLTTITNGQQLQRSLNLFRPMPEQDRKPAAAEVWVGSCSPTVVHRPKVLCSSTNPQPRSCCRSRMLTMLAWTKHP